MLLGFEASLVTYIAHCDTTVRLVVFHDTGAVDQLHGVSRTAGDQSGGGICAITENKSVLYQVEISQID